MLTVIDFGAGIVSRVVHALRHCGLDCETTDDPDDSLEAQALMLPLSGPAAAARERLDESGVGDAIIESVANGAPLLGIGLGMHVLADSLESGSIVGLGLLPGLSEQLEGPGGLPVVGWSRVEFPRTHRLLAGVPSGASFQFAHGHHLVPESPSICLAHVESAGRVCAAVEAGRVLGVQFHPQKSGAAGLRVLANFGAIAASRPGSTGAWGIPGPLPEPGRR